MSVSPFQNHKVALGFAGAVILGVAIFAGSLSAPTNVDEGASEQQASEDSEKGEKQVAQNEQPVIADFAPDEELIDDTNGFDPSPSSDDAAGGVSFEATAEEGPSARRPSRASNSINSGSVKISGNPSPPNGGLPIRVSENVRIGTEEE